LVSQKENESSQEYMAKRMDKMVLYSLWDEAMEKGLGETKHEKAPM
jgi:hypothetical protein